MDIEYTDEQMAKLGEFMAAVIIEQVKDDPMKAYVLEEVLEALERGDDVNDELVEMFKNAMMSVLIDGTIELDEENDDS